jgi:hypothetical protein
MEVRLFPNSRRPGVGLGRHRLRDGVASREVSAVGCEKPDQRAKVKNQFKPVKDLRDRGTDMPPQ